MSDIRLIRAPGLLHAEYADAAAVGPDREIVHLAGVSPLDTAGAVVGRGDIPAQMRTTLETLETVLAACEATRTDVVVARILVASDRREDLLTAWALFREHFGEHDMPVTLHGVTVLGYEHQLVEIEATVARDPR